MRHFFKALSFCVYFLLLAVFIGCAPKSKIENASLDLPQDSSYFLSGNDLVLPKNITETLKENYLKIWYWPWTDPSPNLNVEEVFWMAPSLLKLKGYGPNLKPYSYKELQEIYDSLDIVNYPSAEIKAIVTRDAMVRAVPTLKPYFKTRENYPFDRWQNSLIFAGTPVLITHFNPTKEWAHIQSSFVYGWVRVEDLAKITPEDEKLLLGIKQYVMPNHDRIGIYNDGDLVITGSELNKLSDKELALKAPNVSVFARVAPEDKLRIVNAYRSNGEVCAMTGDGVNDAPALKQADIGVAMGKVGTDVAKEAADMLLLDDNFTTIEVAVREGRRVYHNIQKVIQFLLSGNIAEVLVVFVSVLFNLSVPILAVHILFVNLVTDTLPALALGVDPENPDDMKKKPIKSGSLFEKGLIVRVVFYGILIGMISLAAYLIGSIDSYEVGMTMAFLVLCLSQIVHALNQHSDTLSVFSKKHPRNKYLYLAMFISFAILMLVVFIPPLASFFSLASLSLSEWVIVSLLSISPLVFLEIFKLIRNI